MEKTVTEDIPHEIVESSTAPAETPAIETDIQREIKKFNLADAKISEIVSKYSNLEINGLEDRDGYKKVYAAWQEVRQLRLLIEKKRKEIKADYLVISRAIDKEGNRLNDLVE